MIGQRVKWGRLLPVLGLLLVVGVVSAAWASETKITGKLIAAPPELAGKYAPVALESKDGKYALVNNAITKKLEKNIGQEVDITGEVSEVEGQKVIKPYIFAKKGPKSKFKQPDAL